MKCNFSVNDKKVRLNAPNSIPSILFNELNNKYGVEKSLKIYNRLITNPDQFEGWVFLNKASLIPNNKFNTANIGKAFYVGNYFDLDKENGQLVDTEIVLNKMLEKGERLEDKIYIYTNKDLFNKSLSNQRLGTSDLFENIADEPEFEEGKEIAERRIYSNYDNFKYNQIENGKSYKGITKSSLQGNEGLLSMLTFDREPKIELVLEREDIKQIINAVPDEIQTVNYDTVDLINTYLGLKLTIEDATNYLDYLLSGYDGYNEYLFKSLDIQIQELLKYQAKELHNKKVSELDYRQFIELPNIQLWKDAVILNKSNYDNLDTDKKAQIELALNTEIDNKILDILRDNQISIDEFNFVTSLIINDLLINNMTTGIYTTKDFIESYHKTLELDSEFEKFQSLEQKEVEVSEILNVADGEFKSELHNYIFEEVINKLQTFFGISLDNEYYEELEDKITDNINEQTEQFDRDTTRTTGFSFTQKEFRDFLSFIPYRDNGTLKMVDGTKVFRLLQYTFSSKLLVKSNLFDEFELMLETLSKTNPQVKALKERYEMVKPLFHGITELFINEISAIPKLHYQVVYDPNSNQANIFNSNNNQSDIKQVREWSSRNRLVISKALKVEEAITALKQDSEENIATIKKYLNNIGISLANGTIKYLILNSKDNRTEAEQDFIDYFDGAEGTDWLQKERDNFTQFLRAVDKKLEENQDIFSREQGVTLYSDMIKLAKINLLFDDSLVESSFKNSANDTIFSYGKPTHIDYVTRWVRNEEFRNNLRAQEDNFYFSIDNHLLSLPQEVFNDFQTVLAGNIRQAVIDKNDAALVKRRNRTETRKEGKDFKDAGNVAFDIVRISYFLNSNFNINVKSDNTTMTVRRSLLIPMLLETSNTSLALPFVKGTLVKTGNKFEQISFVEGKSISNEGKRVLTKIYTDEFVRAEKRLKYTTKGLKELALLMRSLKAGVPDTDVMSSLSFPLLDKYDVDIKFKPESEGEPAIPIITLGSAFNTFMVKNTLVSDTLNEWFEEYKAIVKRNEVKLNEYIKELYNNGTATEPELEPLDKQDYTTLIKEVEDHHYKAYQDYINKLIDKELITKEKNGELKNISLPIEQSEEYDKYTSLESMLLDFVLNEFIYRHNFHELITGDLTTSKGFDDLVKRNKLPNGAGNSVHPEAIIKVASIHEPKFNHVNFGEIDRADAQTFGNVDFYTDIIRTTRVYSEKIQLIYQKIRLGLDITHEEKKYLEKNKVALNNYKDVLYQTNYAHKDSIHWLSPNLTSYYPAENKDQVKVLTDEIKRVENTKFMSVNRFYPASVERYNQLNTELPFNDFKGEIFELFVNDLMQSDKIEKNEAISRAKTLLKQPYWNTRLYIFSKYNELYALSKHNGSQEKHELRLNMFKFDIKLVSPPTVEKRAKPLKLPISYVSSLNRTHDEKVQNLLLTTTKINAIHMKEALSVPSGKSQITYFTQVIKLIVGEQNNNTLYELDGEHYEIGEVLNQYRQVLGDKKAKSFFDALKYLVKDFENSDEYKKSSNNLQLFYNKMANTLELSNERELLVKLFKDVNFNLNSPITAQKFVELLVSQFNKGVLSQKANGRKFTLVSDVFEELVVELDENGVETNIIEFDKKGAIDLNTKHSNGQLKYKKRRLKYTMPEFSNKVVVKTKVNGKLKVTELDLFNDADFVSKFDGELERAKLLIAKLNKALPEEFDALYRDFLPLKKKIQEISNAYVSELYRTGKIEGDLVSGIEEVVSFTDFTNHSGGAKGYDAEWDLIGEEFGMINNKHYLLPVDGEVADNRLKSKGVKPVDATNDIGEISLTGKATGEAQIAVTNAERIMGRIEPTHTTRNTKKIRNYAQVKNADAIYAIGSLIPKGAEITVAKGKATKRALVPQVNGGTSVAVQLGIMMDKPTYVFNQVSNDTYNIGWYKWDSQVNDFIAIDTPVLTKNFAGIGTSSNTTEQGKQAIRDVYQRTKDSFGIEEEVEQAQEYKWARYSDNSYEVSSQGDKRFSALYAKLKDGRTIEEAYQLDVKGYRTQGNDWKLGKGKAPIRSITKEQQWEEYKGLWRTYLKENPVLFKELQEKAKGKTLTDKFASTDISQARALAEILNDYLEGYQSGLKWALNNQAQTKLTATDIYNELGNVTKSEGVVIGFEPEVDNDKEGFNTLEPKDYENTGLLYNEVYQLGKTTYTFFKAGDLITGGFTSNNADLGYASKAERTYFDVKEKGEFLGYVDLKFVKEQWEQNIKFRGGRDLSFVNETKPQILKSSEPIKTNTFKGGLSKETSIEVFVDGSDIKSTGAIGFGVNTTIDGKDYSISGAFDTNDLTTLSKDLGIEITNKPSNVVMEFYGSLVAIRNTPKDRFITIKQDLEGVQLYILSGLLERLSGKTFLSKKQYDNWYKSLTEQEKSDYYNKVKDIISLDEALIKKFNWDGRKGFYAEDTNVKAIQTKIVDLILDRKGTISYEWVKGHSGNIGNEKVDAVAKNRTIFNTYKDLFKPLSVSVDSNENSNILKSTVSSKQPRIYTYKTFLNQEVPAFKQVNPNGVIAFRTKGNDYLKAYEEGAVGNPFSSTDKGLIQNVGTVKDAVEMFIMWATGDIKLLDRLTDKQKADIAKLKPYREALQRDLKNGKFKGSKILYYKELNEPSHATALDYLINKYDWERGNISGNNRTSVVPFNTFKVPVSNTLKPFLEVYFTSNDESAIEPFAKQLTDTDKILLSKAIGRTYKNIKDFDWNEALWSDVGTDELYYYLKTGNNLTKDVNESLYESELYKEYKEFVDENKVFVENFSKLSKEVQLEQKKLYDEVKEQYNNFKDEITDLEYDIRENLINQVNSDIPVIIEQEELPTKQVSNEIILTEPKGIKFKEGVYVNQKGLTKEEQLELFNYLKPYLENQAYKTNKSRYANKMMGLGLRWDYKANNSGINKIFPELGDRNPVTVGSNLAGKNTSYAYYDKSINGLDLGTITPRFKELISKATGIDIKDYDGAIINLYDADTFIGNHSDLEESKSAERYPVVVVNIGGSGNFTAGTSTNDNIDLKAGAGYVFGFNGVNRTIPHSTKASKQDGFLPQITTKLDGRTYEAGSYRVTITMRRVMPLNGLQTEPDLYNKQVSANVGTTQKGYELFEGVYTNEEQTLAIDKFKSFLNGEIKVNNQSKFALLKGRGGVGKTTIVRKILENIPPFEIMYIAPTHQAKNQLSVSSGQKASTVASALAIKLNENTGKFEPDEFARKNGIPISNVKYVVIDESSMLSDALFDYINELTRSDAKIILMGDNAQEPPIGQEDDSKVFNYILSELVQRMRQDDKSPILPLTDEVANNVESDRPILKAITNRNTDFNVEDNAGVIFERSDKVVFDMWLEDYKANPAGTKLITFNNENNTKSQSVKTLNEQARQLLYPNGVDEFIVGDILTGYGTYMEGLTPVIQNSSDYEILSISDVKQLTAYISAYSRFKGQRDLDIPYEGYYATVRNTVTNEIAEIILPTINSREKVDTLINNYYNGNEVAQDIQMGVKISQAFVNLKYGYARTTRKGQSATYRNVYVFEDNILSNPNGNNKNMNQSLYTATSRASDKLVIISKSNGTNPDLVVVNPTQKSHLKSLNLKPVKDKAVVEEKSDIKNTSTNKKPKQSKPTFEIAYNIGDISKQGFAEAMITVPNKDFEDYFYNLEYFSTRIPAQDKHSMFVFKPVQKLPKEYGDSAIVPLEIIAISGADFDIDSIYSITKEFYVGRDINGKPYLIDYSKINEEQATKYLVANLFKVEYEKYMLDELNKELYGDEDEVRIQLLERKVKREKAKIDILERVKRKVAAMPDLIKQVEYKLFIEYTKKNSREFKEEKQLLLKSNLIEPKKKRAYKEAKANVKRLSEKVNLFYKVYGLSIGVFDSLKLKSALLFDTDTDTTVELVDTNVSLQSVLELATLFVPEDITLNKDITEEQEKYEAIYDLFGETFDNNKREFKNAFSDLEISEDENIDFDVKVVLKKVLTNKVFHLILTNKLLQEKPVQAFKLAYSEFSKLDTSSLTDEILFNLPYFIYEYEKNIVRYKNIITDVENQIDTHLLNKLEIPIYSKFKSSDSYAFNQNELVKLNQMLYLNSGSVEIVEINGTYKIKSIATEPAVMDYYTGGRKPDVSDPNKSVLLPHLGNTLSLAFYGNTIAAINDGFTSIGSGDAFENVKEAKGFIGFPALYAPLFQFLNGLAKFKTNTKDKMKDGISLNPAFRFKIDGVKYDTIASSWGEEYAIGIVDGELQVIDRVTIRQQDANSASLSAATDNPTHKITAKLNVDINLFSYVLYMRMVGVPLSVSYSMMQLPIIQDDKNINAAREFELKGLKNKNSYNYLMSISTDVKDNPNYSDISNIKNPYDTVKSLEEPKTISTGKYPALLALLNTFFTDELPVYREPTKVDGKLIYISIKQTGFLKFTTVEYKEQADVSLELNDIFHSITNEIEVMQYFYSVDKLSQLTKYDSYVGLQEVINQKMALKDDKVKDDLFNMLRKYRRIVATSMNAYPVFNTIKAGNKFLPDVIKLTTTLDKKLSVRLSDASGYEGVALSMDKLGIKEKDGQIIVNPSNDTLFDMSLLLKDYSVRKNLEMFNIVYKKVIPNMVLSKKPEFQVINSLFQSTLSPRLAYSRKEEADKMTSAFINTLVKNFNDRLFDLQTVFPFYNSKFEVVDGVLVNPYEDVVNKIERIIKQKPELEKLSFINLLTLKKVELNADGITGSSVTITTFDKKDKDLEDAINKDLKKIELSEPDLFNLLVSHLYSKTNGLMMNGSFMPYLPDSIHKSISKGLDRIDMRDLSQLATLLNTTKNKLITDFTTTYLAYSGNNHLVLSFNNLDNYKSTPAELHISRKNSKLDSEVDRLELIVLSSSKMKEDDNLSRYVQEVKGGVNISIPPYIMVGNALYRRIVKVYSGKETVYVYQSIPIIELSNVFPVFSYKEYIKLMMDGIKSYTASTATYSSEQQLDLKLRSDDRYQFLQQSLNNFNQPVEFRIEIADLTEKSVSQYVLSYFKENANNETPVVVFYNSFEPNIATNNIELGSEEGLVKYVEGNTLKTGSISSILTTAKDDFSGINEISKEIISDYLDIDKKSFGLRFKDNTWTAEDLMLLENLYTIYSLQKGNNYNFVYYVDNIDTTELVDLEIVTFLKHKGWNVFTVSYGTEEQNGLVIPHFNTFHHNTGSTFKSNRLPDNTYILGVENIANAKSEIEAAKVTQLSISGYKSALLSKFKTVSIKDEFKGLTYDYNGVETDIVNIADVKGYYRNNYFNISGLPYQTKLSVDGELQSVYTPETIIKQGDIVITGKQANSLEKYLKSKENNEVNKVVLSFNSETTTFKSASRFDKAFLEFEVNKPIKVTKVLDVLNETTLGKNVTAFLNVYNSFSVPDLTDFNESQLTVDEFNAKLNLKDKVKSDEKFIKDTGFNSIYYVYNTLAKKKYDIDTNGVSGSKYNETLLKSLFELAMQNEKFYDSINNNGGLMLFDVMKSLGKSPFFLLYTNKTEIELLKEAYINARNYVTSFKLKSEVGDIESGFLLTGNPIRLIDNDKFGTTKVMLFEQKGKEEKEKVSTNLITNNVSNLQPITNPNVRNTISNRVTKTLLSSPYNMVLDALNEVKALLNETFEPIDIDVVAQFVNIEEAKSNHIFYDTEGNKVLNYDDLTKVIENKLGIPTIKKEIERIKDKLNLRPKSDKIVATAITFDEFKTTDADVVIMEATFEQMLEIANSNTDKAVFFSNYEILELTAPLSTLLSIFKVVEFNEVARQIIIANTLMNNSNQVSVVNGMFGNGDYKGLIHTLSTSDNVLIDRLSKRAKC